MKRIDSCTAEGGKKPVSQKQNGCCGTPDDSRVQEFSLLVGKVAGNCKAGEKWSLSGMEERKIPVLSCEGPCVKGEIARRAAGILPRRDNRFQRACHGESFYVPYSSMAGWVRSSSSVVMIDGCFLSCHGRVLENLADSKKIVQINAHAIHKKHGDDFALEEVSDSMLDELAEQVAEVIRSMYQRQQGETGWETVDASFTGEKGGATE